MNQNLETLLTDKGRPNFKSEGERRIAYFLDHNSIRYQYEPGVLVASPNGKPRIWYPDFFLPEFGTYIEYFGLAGGQDYDQGIRRKQEVYSSMRLDVISVYPWTFCEDWQEYIMRQLQRTAIRRYRKLMAKPYWSRHRSAKYPQAISERRLYHQGTRKRY